MFYYGVLLLVWSIRELVIRPRFDVDFNVWQDAVISTIIKVLVWTLPAFFYVRHYEECLYVPLKKMFSMKIKWLPYLGIIASFFLYHLTGAFITYGKIGINEHFHLSSLPGVVLFVGITEEFAFRGWLLNSTFREEKKWQSILLNALLFVGIHFPIWLHRGLFYEPNLLLQDVLVVFILSVIFSWSFIKSKNILVPMLIHMCWNLFDILFFGT